MDGARGQCLGSSWLSFLSYHRQSDWRRWRSPPTRRVVRPICLSEKDIWVVWSLRHLFAGPFAEHLVFKGGTSLSKAYGAIRRFSEDVDLTYDIRAIASDLVGDADVPLPISKSQEKKWSKEIRSRLSNWVGSEIVPRLQQDLASQGLTATVRAEDDKVFIEYVPLAVGTGYVAPAVMLEFGARSTGEPSEWRDVQCDAAAYLPTVEFPMARPQVMRAERTFWEKATLIHVECHRPSLRPSAERLSRHWYDLARLADHEVGQQAMSDSELLRDVLRIKETFYRSGYSHYDRCLAAGLRLIPDEPLLAALAQDRKSVV